MDVQGKVAVVTGASSGLGEATARLLASRGATVVLLARSEEKLQAICQEITTAGGKASFYSVDLSRASAIANIAGKVIRDCGAPDILVNNAGMGRWLEIEATNSSEMEAMMSVPYFAAFNLTRAFIEPMLKRNAGHIVNVTSGAAMLPVPGAVAYSTARWAMAGFSDALYADLYETDIGVSLYVAAKIDTPYFANNPGAEERIPKADIMIPTMSVQKSARDVLKCIRWNRRRLYAPWVFWMFMQFKKVMPGFVDWLTIKTGWRRK